MLRKQKRRKQSPCLPKVFNGGDQRTSKKKSREVWPLLQSDQKMPSETTFLKIWVCVRTQRLARCAKTPPRRTAWSSTDCFLLLCPCVVVWVTALPAWVLLTMAHRVPAAMQTENTGFTKRLLPLRNGILSPSCPAALERRWSPQFCLQRELGTCHSC